MTLQGTLVFVLLVTTLNSHPKKVVPPNVQDDIFYGCVLKHREPDPNWYVFGWASATKDVDCSHEVSLHFEDQIVVDPRCTWSQLAAYDSYDKASKECKLFLKIIREEAKKAKMKGKRRD